MSDTATSVEVAPAPPSSAATADHGALSSGLKDSLSDPLAGPPPSSSFGAAAPRPVQLYGGGSLSSRLALQFDGVGAGGLASDGVHAAAATATAGPGSALPHQAKLESSFGTSLSHVKAHTGGAAQSANREFGSQAFASGNNIAFSSPAPDLHTAAHEVAHTFQQSAGVQLKGGVGAAGDSYEVQADKIADKVVAGESVASMVGSGSSASTAVQADGGKIRKPKADEEVPSASSDAMVADPATTPAVAKPDSGQQKDVQSALTKEASSESQAKPKPLPPKEAETNKTGKKPDFKIAEEKEYSLDLSVPLGMTGFNIDVKAKVKTSKETKQDPANFKDDAAREKNTKTLISGEIKAGVSFNLLFFKIGLRAFGNMESEIEGDKGLVDAIKLSISEFTRWRLSDEVDAVTKKLANVDKAVAKRKPSIEKSFDELIAETKKSTINYDKIKEEAGTENSWINPSRTLLENIRKESKDLKDELASETKMPEADAEKAADFFFDVGAIKGRVQAVADAAKDKKDGSALSALASKAKAESIGAIDSGVAQARGAIESCDFKVPTPGVKVTGAIGAEVYAGFTFGGDNEGEVSLGAGAKFDTSRTKKEKNNKGDEREVFDKHAEAVVKLNGEISVAGFQGSIGMELGINRGKKTLKGTLDLSTPELPLGITQSDLPEALELVRTLMAEDGAASKKVIDDGKKAQEINAKNSGEEQGKLSRVLTQTKTKLASLDKVKAILSFVGDKAKRIKDGEAGKTKIMVGGEFQVGADGAGGKAYLGLGNATELGGDLGVLKAKVQMIKATKLIADWSA